MSMVPFAGLPGSATLWIFGAVAPFNDEHIRILNQRMPAHLAAWAAHGEDVSAGWDVRYNRFILIGIDERTTSLTGCSQDSMRENIRQFSRDIDSEIILGSSHVFYRDANADIHCVTRQEFKKLIDTSIINENTIVFDNTIEKVEYLQQGKWEIPVRTAWHAHAFGITARVS